VVAGLATDTTTTNQTPAGDFRMVDFLTFAGVDPVSRGQ
jgi:hypothetical protein